LFFAVSVAAGQEAAPRHDFKAAAFQQNNGLVTVSCSMPDVLQETLRAVRLRYGWVVNFEKPAYFSTYDLVDDTDPEWRSKHPQAKGVTRSAGELFSAIYPEVADISPFSAEEERILSALLSQYNSSGNPGKFSLRRSGDGTYSVIGVAVRDAHGAVVSLPPLLESRISLPMQQRTVEASVRLILAGLSTVSGKKVIAVSLPTNILQNVTSTIGGENVPARDLLIEALRATGRPLIWELGYDPDPQIYLMRIEVAMQSTSDVPGKQSVKAIDDPRNRLAR
jgi:hypothetical protein